MSEYIKETMRKLACKDDEAELTQGQRTWLVLNHWALILMLSTMVWAYSSTVSLVTGRLMLGYMPSLGGFGNKATPFQ